MKKVERSLKIFRNFSMTKSKRALLISLMTLHLLIFRHRIKHKEDLIERAALAQKESSEKNLSLTLKII